MHVPALFRLDDPRELSQVIADHPLGTLIACKEGRIIANEVVFITEHRDGQMVSLVGHLANANEFTRLLSDGDAVLVVFKGAQGYISPSNYPSKKIDGKVVPTFNYVVVQVTGKVRLLTDVEIKRTIVTRMTDLMEQGRERPWSVLDAPLDFIDALLGGITGLIIEITDVNGKVKMSQNRPEIDIDSIVNHQRSENPLLSQSVEKYNAFKKDP